MKSVYFILILLFLNGCTVYHPQMSDLPLIEHKGDLRIDAGASLFPAVHSTISYGMTGKIAIQAFVSAGLEERFIFQLSPGIYRHMKDETTVEFYGGIGFGHADTKRNSLANNIWETNYTESLYGNYQLYYFQLNWGKNTKESGMLDWAVGLKTGLFHSALMDQNYYTFYSETGPYVRNVENSVLIEPVFSFRIGEEKNKFTFRIGFTRLVNLNRAANQVPAFPINLGFGVNFKPE